VELRLGTLGDHHRQRGLAGPGWAMEDQAAEPVGRKHAGEQLAGTKEVLLPDELLQRPRPHPRRQRRRRLNIRALTSLEQPFISATIMHGGYYTGETVDCNSLACAR